MRIYLAHMKANYASENDGYVMALRTAEHDRTLYSFEALNGRATLPITNANFPGLQHQQELDGHGVRTRFAGG